MLNQELKEILQGLNYNFFFKCSKRLQPKVMHHFEDINHNIHQNFLF